MDIHMILEVSASLILTVAVFAGAVWLSQKTKLPIFNPLLVSVAAIMALITLLQVPLIFV